MHYDERDPSDPQATDEDAQREPTGEPTSEAEPSGDAPPTPPDRGPEGTDWPSEDFAGREAGQAPAETQPASPREPWPVEQAAAAEAEPAEPQVQPGAPPGPDEVESPATYAQEPPPSEVEAYPAATGAPAADDELSAAAHTVPATGGAVGESTRCPRCGTENRPGLAFCRNCGQRLMAAGVAATVERPASPEGTQACPRCGTHNRAGVGFCQNCGANLRAAASGYVPPAVAPSTGAEPAAREARRAAVLGPVVLLIGLVGIVTAYLLPFPYGSGSLFERAFGAGGYGIGFWSGYPDVTGGLADQAYFGLAAPAPLVALLLVALAVAGFVRAAPGVVQGVGLIIALAWAVAIAILFVVVELAANLGDDLVGLLGSLSPSGIIFFLSALIVLIGTLTRFARS